MVNIYIVYDLKSNLDNVDPTLKVVSATFLLVCFLSLALVKLRKKFFISLQKLFLFSRISNFRILHFEIS